jgi:SHAQKYF class myb-like DNA-binding protein
MEASGYDYADLLLTPPSGTEATSYEEFADAGTSSPLFLEGDTNSNNAMDTLTAAAVAAKPATPQSVSAQQHGGAPLGKVVDTGQEHTGRWTREEHHAFLKGLQMYGKEWKKVAARVKTRTVVQTRTHAQKYFQKMQRFREVSFYCHSSQ